MNRLRSAVLATVCLGLAAIARSAETAEEDVAMNRSDARVLFMTLSAAPGSKGPKTFDVHLAHEGRRFPRGFAEGFNRAAHDVDASGLTVEGDRVSGMLKVTLQPDQWTPKTPLSCAFKVEGRIDKDFAWQGTYEGTVGDEKANGTLTAREDKAPVVADYSNATARLYLHAGFLTDYWDRDAAAELRIRDGGIVEAIAYREGAAEMEVGTLRMNSASLAGECRVTYPGQPTCKMKFEGTVVGPWVGGGFELAAEGKTAERRRFRGYVEFGAKAKTLEATEPAQPLPDPATPGSAKRMIDKEIAKAKAWAMTDAFEAREHKAGNETGMPYRLFKPSVNDPGAKYPLVLFLHGADARGNDNVKNYTHFGMLLGARIWALPENQAKHPCFVVAPQTQDSWKGESLDRVLDLVEALSREFNIDRDRLYVTGLSLGGFGTFHALAARPRMFAAGVPVCGGGNVETAAGFAHVPLWVFHGANDNLVKPEESRKMVEALRKAGGNPAYTEYPGVGHNSFLEAYSEPALVDWVMAQRRKR